LAPTTTVATTTTTAPPAAFVAAGPYDAGVTTIDLGDRFVEVWYPIDPGSGREPTALVEPAEVLPEFLLELLPTSLTAPFDTGAHRDADAATGPFPLAFYSHGFGGYRLVATNYATHLASHGFVVAAIDHLERGLVAQISGQVVDAPGQELLDLNRTLELLAERADDDTDLLGGTVDVTRVAVIGHSAGGGAVNQAASEAWMDAGVSISAGANGLEEKGKPYLVLVAELDAVVPASASRALYAFLTGPRVYLEIADAGHNSFNDVCPPLYESGEVAELEALVGPEQTTRAADGCTDDYEDPRLVQELAGHATVAFLKQHLDVGPTPGSLDEAFLIGLGTATPSVVEAASP